jgi:flagellar hook-basal body complex protein FliE
MTNLPVAPIAPVTAPSLLPPIMPVPQAALQSHAVAGTAFSNLLMQGIDAVNGKVLDANNAVREFTLDDSAMPVHQVSYALSQAQLSLELMMQVRSRLVDGYQQLMNMQL